MSETCWYNSKKMRLDDGCNNNLNGDSEQESEKWSCAGDTSLVEPEILQDMGVSMLADGEASRESLQAMKTQECTISPKNFTTEKHLKNSQLKHEIPKESLNNDNFDNENLNRLILETAEIIDYAALNNESGHSAKKEKYVHPTENYKGNSNESTDKVTIKNHELANKKKQNIMPEESILGSFSDELILMIFKYLPKASLVQSMLVCKRWYRIGLDEVLWTRLDLGNKIITKGTLGNILPRGIQILRLAQTEIAHPAFLPNPYIDWSSFTCKLQYLDLSMVGINIIDLAEILAKCRQLKKLSLENCKLNEACCTAIGENENLEVLNLTMCEGINTKCLKFLTALKSLTALNVGWCTLDAQSVAFICTSLPSSVVRLNIAGCRRSMTDEDIQNLVKQCPSMVELDLSDCTLLTINTIQHLMSLTNLEHLSLSRCYSISPSMSSRLASMPKLKYLDFFGMLTNDAVKLFKSRYKHVELNKYMFSSIARPTVGIRRTSIWGLQVKD
ncbi:hypothetical protein TKK_0017423 [Trichogramma kaykai]|uniref:F-box domain-containing protein n=1 Tax=Trichogramma kaykai TaxID=54128 RepID=A0ABD2W4D5_9HYME